MGTLATFLPLIKEIRRGRRPPRLEHSLFYTDSEDGTELFCTLIGNNTRECVVVAHPAVVGSYFEQVVSLAEEISQSFTSVIFDFRGHGRSDGRCPIGFRKVSEDLEAVINRLKEMRFTKIGVAGFSMGAAAAVLLCARSDSIDSLVTIGCPPSMPDISQATDHPLITRAALRMAGMRLLPERDPGPSPIDVISELCGLPKFMIFGEWEVAPIEEISLFLDRAAGPKREMTVPGAWHADLMGRETTVREWFEDTLRCDSP